MASKTPQYAAAAEKPATDLQARFVPWLVEKTGYDPSNSSPEEAFAEGVKLAVALRMTFQASDENKQATQDRRASKAAATPAQKETAKAVAQGTKRRAPAKKTAPETPAKKVAPAKRAPRRRHAAPTEAADF